MKDGKLALFLMLGQTAAKTVERIPGTAPTQPLMVSDSFDLRLSLPDHVKRAYSMSEVYRLFFVLENHVRDFVLSALTERHGESWWDKVPTDVQGEVKKLEETEEQKQWMALESRSKLHLTTLPQLLRIIDENWKGCFDELIRDKSLIQEMRHVGHLRNATCHMSVVSAEETERVKQVMRDWFRVVSP